MIHSGLALGLSFSQKIKAYYPIKVFILSSLNGSIIYGVDGCIYIHWHHFFVLNEKRSVNPYN